MLKCDTHTHSLYSRHAYSTVEENVREAAEQGLELLAVTDHFSDMLYPEVHIKHFQYLFNQATLPESWHGVRLLHGCEADIVDLDGHLFGHHIPVTENIVGMKYKKIQNLDEFICSRMDFVIASVHGKAFAQEATLAQTTDMYIKAMEHKRVLILGHIGRSGVPFEMDPVLLAAKENHKLIELNEHSFHKNYPEAARRCRAIALRCAELEVPVSVASDAHISCHIGRFDQVSQMLEEIHFPQELIASRDKEAFLNAMAAAGISS